MEDVTNVSLLYLAQVVVGKQDEVLVIDSRTFCEYNTSHVMDAVNVWSSKLRKKRLQQGSMLVHDYLQQACHHSLKDSSVSEVIVYDQSSTDVESIPQDSFLYVLSVKLSRAFPKVHLLSGGFLEFQSTYPELCTDSSFKTSPLTSLSQPCLPVASSGPTKILPFLYLGSQYDANNFQMLKDHNILYELNVSTSCPKPSFLQDSHFMRIPVNDSFCEKLLPFFEEAFRFIDAVRELGGCVLVHCLAGISRSPTVAIAYVMKHVRLHYDEAYRYVKSRRPTISPNINFVGQLVELDRQLMKAGHFSVISSEPSSALPIFHDCDKENIDVGNRLFSRFSSLQDNQSKSAFSQNEFIRSDLAVPLTSSNSHTESSNIFIRREFAVPSSEARELDSVLSSCSSVNSTLDSTSISPSDYDVLSRLCLPGSDRLPSSPCSSPTPTSATSECYEFSESLCSSFLQDEDSCCTPCSSSEFSPVSSLLSEHNGDFSSSMTVTKCTVAASEEFGGDHSDKTGFKMVVVQMEDKVNDLAKTKDGAGSNSRLCYGFSESLWPPMSYCSTASIEINGSNPADFGTVLQKPIYVVEVQHQPSTVAYIKSESTKPIIVHETKVYPVSCSDSQLLPTEAVAPVTEDVGVYQEWQQNTNTRNNCAERIIPIQYENSSDLTVNPNHVSVIRGKLTGNTAQEKESKVSSAKQIALPPVPDKATNGNETLFCTYPLPRCYSSSETHLNMRRLLESRSLPGCEVQMARKSSSTDEVGHTGGGWSLHPPPIVHTPSTSSQCSELNAQTHKNCSPCVITLPCELARCDSWSTSGLGSEVSDWESLQEESHLTQSDDALGPFDAVFSEIFPGDSRDSLFSSTESHAELAGQGHSALLEGHLRHHSFQDSQCAFQRKNQRAIALRMPRPASLPGVTGSYFPWQDSVELEINDPNFECGKESFVTRLAKQNTPLPKSQSHFEEEEYVRRKLQEEGKTKISELCGKSHKERCVLQDCQSLASAFVEYPPVNPRTMGEFVRFTSLSVAQELMKSMEEMLEAEISEIKRQTASLSTRLNNLLSSSKEPSGFLSDATY